ncbi:MAG TPA: AMP-binding protein, partial [Pyrinomonadaceae bacterium]|nr:AMP-binding protein [Pyrinomonadaceae bacterium]
GAIVVPVDVQSEPTFVQRVQQQVGAKVAIGDLAACEQFPLELPLIHLEEISSTNAFPDISDAPLSNSTLDVPLSGADIAEIIFTSGTTAEPKGVVITHQNFLANLETLERGIRPYRKWERFAHPIRFLNLVPLSHVFGQLMGVFVPQLLGGEVFFSDSLKPTEIFEIVKRERISVVVCVPRMLEVMKDAIETRFADRGKFRESLKASDSSIAKRWWTFRHVHQMLGWKFWAFVSGGASLDRGTEEFWQRLGFAVIQGYGSTETASLVTVNHPFKTKAGSIGAVLPGQQVRLAENGEILVRGPNVSPGYWKDNNNGGLGKGKDREEFDSTPHADEDTTTAGKWFHTGDVGEIDAEGNLFFKGRQKEVIVTSAGMNIYPADLEAVLADQPEIKMCAVVGIDSPRGPEPAAVLILTGQTLSGGFGNTEAEGQARRAVERANQSLAPFQRLRRWFIWPDTDFPRTLNQKIRKGLIAERIQDTHVRHVAQGNFRTSELAQILAHVSGEEARPVQPEENLATDLKLDSLGRVELLSVIEDHYGIEIDESSFNEATTVAGIEHIIALSDPNAERANSREAEYPYPHWPHRSAINWLRIAALKLIVFPIVKLLGRANVAGLENLNGLKNPLLFVSNHLTMVDHALILWALPRRFQTSMSIAMDGELLRQWLNPALGTGLLERLKLRGQYLLVAFFFNIFSMPQQSGFRRSFRFAGEMMDLGYSILVFPEGRRSPDGRLQPLRQGIGILAKQLDAEVVPVRIDGLYELAHQRRHRAPKGAIRITIGKAVRYASKTTPDEITKDLSIRLER